jgi:hypothetical protein
MDALTLQVSQIRDEMHGEFSAIRASLDALDSRLTGQIDALDDRLTGLDGRLTGLDGRLTGLDDRLTGQIESVRLELGTQMRVLHEEVISRLALLQEGRARRSKRR